MKNLLPFLRTAWIVIASAVTVVVIAKEITNEFRPQVKPDMPRILARLESAIRDFSPQGHRFTIQVTGDSDLLRVSDQNDGATPLLSMDHAGNFTITSTVPEVLEGQHDFRSFMLLCQIAERMKSDTESLDFKTWIADATTTTSENDPLPMFIGGQFKAIHSITNDVMQITVLN
jgi:hypothetical protein